MKTFAKWFGGIALIFLIIIFVIVSTHSGQNSNQNYTTQTASDSINIGDDVILGNNADNVLLGVTKDDFEELVKLAVAKDNVGVTKMVLDGRAFMVDKGTQARVIDAGFTAYEVRIMSGSHYGDSGWVPAEFCHKSYSNQNSTTQPQQSTTNQSQSSNTQSQKPDLELVGGIEGVHDEIIDYSHYIIGSIRNNTSRKYNYVQVTFILLDKDKNQVGTAMDNINDLEPGATWKFKALIYDDSEVKYYKLGDITGD